MGDLSPKQLRILKVLREAGGWLTRAEMEEQAGRKGFFFALGAPTRDIRPESLEQLGYVERRDMSMPFEYRITELGDRALSEHEREYGEVSLMTEESRTEEPDVNRGHYFELLDRACIASSYVEMALGDHPALARHPELQRMYDEVIDRLESLYQAVGQFEETWS